MTHTISYSELARRVGVNRSTITRLARGRLAPAVLSLGRLDGKHSAITDYLCERGVRPYERWITIEQFAKLAGRPLSDVLEACDLTVEKLVEIRKKNTE